MKTNEKHEAVARIARRSRVLVGLLVAALCFAGPSRAQSSAASAAAPAKPAAPSAKSPASRAKAAHEGITVHGHWTIEVKNPDGTVASHREFENAIDPEFGADLLTGLLSGQYVPGGFFVQLVGVGAAGCSGLPFGCSSLLFDPRNTVYCPSGSVPGSCGQLTYTPNPLSASPAFAGGYTLTGTLGPVGGGSAITVVRSGVVRCGNAGGLPESAPYPFLQTTPQACSGTLINNTTTPLTGTSITTPPTGIPVIAGQSVAVTVVITFGSS